MCRFLLARASDQMQSAELIAAFAVMCEASRGPGGARQEDGWGVCWKEGDLWQRRTSLRPIWEDVDSFPAFPPARLLVVHARSASFAEHRGNLSHNQPYVEDGLCFVFNGMIRRVRLPMKVEGEIGAQKIFALLRRALETKNGVDALRWLDEMITRHSQHITGMNIGYVKDDRIHVLCEYSRDPDYFAVNVSRQDGVTLVCSEKLPSYAWQTMDKGQVIEL